MQLNRHRDWIAKVALWLFALSATLTLSSLASAQTPSWSSAAGTVWQRATASAAAANGVLYAVGNTSAGSTVESFNAGTNTWTQLASQGPLVADVNGTLFAASGAPATRSVTMALMAAEHEDYCP